MQVSVFYSRIDSIAESHELLCKAAGLFSGERDFTLISERGRKPYFRDSGVKFSLSHSGNVWVCAFAYGEVGLDFQLCSSRANPERVARRYFHQNELEAYLSGTNFYKIWTAKEAAVKLTGWGIDRRFTEFDSTRTPIESSEFPSAVYLTKITGISSDDCSCTLAAYEKAEAELYEIKNG